MRQASNQPLAKGASTYHFGLLCFCVLLFAAGTLTSGCARHFKERPIMAQTVINQSTLKNGLTVYTIESDQVPLVTLDMWVKVGSKDEPENIAGISHYLEHMLFKGTPRLGVGVYDRRIEELGGYLNAATSGDYTHYYMTLPSQHLDRALVDMADVLINSSLDAEEVESERSVILEEISMKQDQPIGFMYDEITQAVYENGPYKNTVIGSEETVKAITRDQLLEHYTRFYTPQNMAFLAIGDFKTEDLIASLEKELGEFQREYKPYRKVSPVTKFASPKEQIWERDWQQTYFFFTIPGHELNTLERVAIDSVAEQILAGGRNSRLVKALREEQRIVSTISAFAPSHKHESFWGIYGACDADKIDAVKAAILAELELLAKKGITNAELKRARKTLITEHLFQTETNSGKSAMLGMSIALLGNESLVNDLPAALEAVTEAQVIEAINGILNHEMSTFAVRPKPLIPVGAPESQGKPTVY